MSRVSQQRRFFDRVHSERRSAEVRLVNEIQREEPGMSRTDAVRSAWLSLYGHDPYERTLGPLRPAA